MKRKRATPIPRPAQRGRRSRRILLAVAIAALVMGALATAPFLQRRAAGKFSSPAVRRPTFHRDVAPVIYAHCAPCHHPGQAAPFNLLSFADVKKRARQIRDLVEQRLMPPWLPDATDGPFVGQRSLSAEQIALIQRWVEQGAVEGDPSEEPAAPTWRDDWQLGTPDLIVQMTEPYTLGADGPDAYRNFVIPIPTTARRFVKGVELQPGNPRVVHHAFMRIDATRESRERDAEEPGPGFSGLHTPPTAQTPDGQFLSWQPGKRHLFVPRGLAWPLEPGSDLVLQMHLRPSGKREVIQSSVGFYFTDEAPTNTPFKIGFMNFAIDIPAGASNHVVRDSYTLAADVAVLSILPHAHYLGKELQAFAMLPDGTRRTLLHIAGWNFDWQGDYQFQNPVFLPKGATLSMVWHYDNSTNNARNPNNPPRRVRYGLQSSDEMAELWMQVLPLRTNDAAALARYNQPRLLQYGIDYNRYLLGLNANDPRAHSELGKAQLFLGQYAEAEPNLRRAADLEPTLDEPHYFLGLLYRMQNKLPDAASEFDTAARLNPRNAKAQGNLGLVLLAQGAFDAAETHLRTALKLNPQDQIARDALDELARTRSATPKKE